MCSAIRHRGPDDAGYAVLSGGEAALASTRLSIVDLETGQQPIFNEERTVAVVCNGEIYNHLEQRDALRRRGHRFRTRSDSEILVHLYEENGTDLFRHLNGEFAFILWDARRRLLLAGRDLSGVKPLFYSRCGSQLLIASEAKAIFTVPAADRTLRLDYFASAGLGVVPANTSAFEQVECLPPGHRLLVQDGNTVEQSAFDPLAFHPDERVTYPRAVAQVREAVTASVRRRLQADVPISCYLSGGLDSTILCGLMARHSSSFSAYHASFSDTEFDESAQAAVVARHYGVPLRVAPCTADTLLTNLIGTVEHVEMPLANCNAVGKFLLSRLVRATGDKACLTGEGADEVFGGYPYFKLEALWQATSKKSLSAHEYSDLWARFQELESRSIGTVWNDTGGWKKHTGPYHYPSFLHLRARGAAPLMPVLFRRRFTPSDLEQRLIREFPPETLAHLHPFNATRKMALGVLAGALIPPLGDRVEMAHSVEGRTPYLDESLIRMSCTLDPSYFIDLRGLREKRLLYDAFDDLVPEALKARHKHPFLSPSWRSLLSTPRGNALAHEYLSPRSVRRAGIYRPATVVALRQLWEHLPTSHSLVKRLDPLMGIILTTQILHERFVPQPWVPREYTNMQNLGAPSTHNSLSGLPSGGDTEP